MSTLDTAFDAELGKDAFLLFVGVEVILPTATIRLLDGSDTVTFSGKTFVGQDDTYGVLQSVEAVADGIDAEAPRLTVSIAPPTVGAAAVLGGSDVQGSALNIWAGVVDVTTGAVIGTPDLWFAGEIDVPTLRASQGSRLIEYEVASVFERFFDQDEGAKLSHPFHQTVWPGEMGLEFVTDVQRQMPWGSDAPRPVLVSYVPPPPPNPYGLPPGFPF